MLHRRGGALKASACLWDVAFAILADHGALVTVVAYVVLLGAEAFNHRYHDRRGE